MKRCLLIVLSLLCLSGCSTLTRHLIQPTASISYHAPIETFPFTTFQVPVTPVMLVRAHVRLSALDPREVHCLADNLYFEARGEGDRGMVAVGYVTLNRKRSSRFADSICQVVHKAERINGRIVLNRCQFSWYCDGLSDHPRNRKMYKHAVALAKQVLRGTVANPIGKSLFFHRTRSGPEPSAYAYQTSIGHHSFFTLRGG